ncbi:RNA methyltransferase [Candidatus Sumerlaeota bacterium]|nr:RNA methyltransferase [Candidatus Sumerlaeota bacterium]
MMRGAHSPSGAFVKSIVPAARKKDGLALAEGERTAMLALQGAWRCKTLVLESGFAATDESGRFREIARQRCIDVHALTGAAMSKISSCDTAPKVAVLVAPPEESFLAMKDTPDRVVVLDRVNDPGNAGTLIRSAAAFGFAAVLTAGSVSLTNEKLIRSSAGNCFLPGVAHAAPEAGVLTEFLRNEYQIFSLMPRAEKSLGELKLDKTRKTALVLGNEASGVDMKIWHFAVPVRIPMRDSVESLNVAMSGVIALYELSRQSLP